MSIWSSRTTIPALDGHAEDANYRAEGEPSLTVDVATARSFHGHVRLALFGDGVDACAVLSPEHARELGEALVSEAMPTSTPLAELVTDEDVQVATGAGDAAVAHILVEDAGLDESQMSAVIATHMRAALEAYGARLLARHGWTP